MELSDKQLDHLLRGNVLHIDGLIVSSIGNGVLRRSKNINLERKVSELWRNTKPHHKVDSGNIRHDSVTYYNNMLEKYAPSKNIILNC